jgi:hypothetical protein
MAGVFGQSLYACGCSTVAGLRLQPFSAHHAMLLLEIESPYITGGAVTVADTTAALIVCRTRKVQGIGPYARFCASWFCRLLWRVWWVFRSHDNVCNELQDHIFSSCKYPQMWIAEESNKGKSTGAPWPYYLVSLIAQEIPSIPYADLWDMPLSELSCHKAIIDERSGGAEIAESDLQELRKLKEASNG